MKKRIAIIALVVSGLLAVLGTACEPDKITVASSDGGSTQQGISVSGEGKVTGQPDVAVLSLGVSSIKPTVKDARDDAAGTMQKVVDAIKADGVADKDVQTSQYSISPEYDYSQGGSGKLVGYRVTNTVTVKVRDVNNTSQVLDDVTAAAGDIVQVQGISFTIDKPDALQDQAREAAVNDAKARAQRLADTAGVKLGDPISITENYTMPVTSDSRQYLVAPATGPGTPIQTGELDVNVTVQVVFAID